MNVKQLAHQECDFHIEIVEVLPPALKEGAQVIGIMLEERRLAIGSLQGIPMQSSPVAVVADAYVACKGFVTIVTDGDGERLWAIWCSNDTAVAVGLLHKTVHALNHHMVIPVQFLIPLHRSEIGGGEKGESLPRTPSQGGGLLMRRIVIYQL